MNRVARAVTVLGTSALPLYDTKLVGEGKMVFIVTKPRATYRRGFWKREAMV